MDVNTITIQYPSNKKVQLETDANTDTTKPKVNWRLKSELFHYNIDQSASVALPNPCGVNLSRSRLSDDSVQCRWPAALTKSRSVIQQRHQNESLTCNDDTAIGHSHFIPQN